MPVAVDIVLPCYNPSDKWHLELIKFYELAKTKFRLHFIVVDDGSSSTTLHASLDLLRAQKIPFDFFSYKPNRGKGYALRAGVLQSTAEYVMYTDIDLPFTQASMEAILDALASGTSDVVAGYRQENYYENKMSGFRKLLSKSFRGFLKNILRLPLSDTQAGLKGFNQKAKKVFLATRINRYLFDFEFIYNCCRRSDIRIGTISVKLKDNVIFSKMPLKVLLPEVLNLFRVLATSSHKRENY